jgi:tetratricopeptide (TPR) repeat protein
MTAKPSEPVSQAEALYAAGQQAFERGNYREAVTAFESGVELAGELSLLGGMLQLWLMNAYSAANRQADAIALGEKLAKHPDRDVRKQSQRVLEILRAPQLKRRADWLTPIPDLSDLETGTDQTVATRPYTPKGQPKPTPADLPSEDLSQINTRDNGFLWIAIALILLTLAGVRWLG